MTPDKTSRVLAYILSVYRSQFGQKTLTTDPEGVGAIHIAKP